MEKYIISLSKKDKKTLSQKALKLTEETGELAKVILPYDSAHGTNHRFVDREKILNEIADVYLANISIAYSLDFTTEEIDEMILKKAKYWDTLQIKEENATFPLPFEIHITVDASEWMENDKENFIKTYKKDCEALGVKPIILDLPVNGDVVKDVMTSSDVFGNNKDAYLESQRIVNSLKDMGYNVIRTKIETVPWHPIVPQSDTHDKLPNNCYFESHIGVEIYPEQKERLEKFIVYLNSEKDSKDSSIKLSQNYFKKSKNGEKFINMITFRDYATNYTSFKSDVDYLKEQLNLRGYSFEKVIIEYSLYDTNVKHDFPWLN